jgi:hypothetical protein
MASPYRPSSLKLRLFPAFVIVLTVVTIILHNAARERQHYLSRAALVHPKFGPWRRLLNCADEGSFLHVTGFDFDAFRD